MRADVGTEVTLDTVVGIPLGYVDRDAALLVCGGTGRRAAVYIVRERGYRQVVAFLSVDRSLYGVDELDDVFSSLGNVYHVKTFVLAVLPALRDLDLNDALRSGVDGGPVLLDDVLALAAVGSLRGSLHQLVRLIGRDDSGQGEECGLKDGVDTGRAHAGLDTELNAVDGVELDVVVGDKLLDLSRKVLLKALHIP